MCKTQDWLHVLCRRSDHRHDGLCVGTNTNGPSIHTRCALFVDRVWGGLCSFFFIFNRFARSVVTCRISFYRRVRRCWVVVVLNIELRRAKCIGVLKWRSAEKSRVELGEWKNFADGSSEVMGDGVPVTTGGIRSSTRRGDDSAVFRGHQSIFQFIETGTRCSYWWARPPCRQVCVFGCCLHPFIIWQSGELINCEFLCILFNVLRNIHVIRHSILMANRTALALVCWQTILAFQTSPAAQKVVDRLRCI